MNVLDAVYRVLIEKGGPLHYKEITELVLDRGLWSSIGKTPWASVNSKLSVDINQYGTASRFHRTEPGVYAVTESKPYSRTTTGLDPEATQREPATTRPMSFLDAAEHVLREAGSTEPMHYTLITERMIASGLVQTGGKTPAHTLQAQVGTDIRRRDARGARQRFVRTGPGMIALATGLPESVAARIKDQNRNVRAARLKLAHEGSPAEFEQLVETLLIRMGFEDVNVTPQGGDGGIDVRGTLVVGGVVKVRMAVQAKRWKGNVGAPVVREVRGSLGAHEQGMIITTSDFSTGARKEAMRHNASPIALMNGTQLAGLLAEYEIGVQRKKYFLLTLDKLNGS